MNHPKSGTATLIFKVSHDSIFSMLKSLTMSSTGNQAVPSALYDNGAWEILWWFLTMSMSLSEMDDVLVAYLGD